MSEITERMREIAIAGLEADLREARDRIAAMRVEHGAEVATLTARIRELEAKRADDNSHAHDPTTTAADQVRIGGWIWGGDWL